MRPTTGKAGTGSEVRGTPDKAVPNAKSGGGM